MGCRRTTVEILHFFNEFCCGKIFRCLELKVLLLVGNCCHETSFCFSVYTTKARCMLMQKRNNFKSAKCEYFLNSILQVPFQKIVPHQNFTEYRQPLILTVQLRNNYKISRFQNQIKSKESRLIAKCGKCTPSRVENTTTKFCIQILKHVAQIV